MTETITNNRNKQAATYGVISAIVCIIFLTIENMVFIGNFIAFYGIKFIGFVIYMIVLGVFTKMIRKSSGGYLTFKEAFSVIFIMILVTEIFYYLYTYIYMYYIDPAFLDKMKNATMAWMEKMNTPQNKIDEAAQKFDSQIEESKHFNFGKNLLSFFTMIIMDSLFGLIVAAIVKKEKPLFPTVQSS